ncbi:unnamed protein product [Mesocestoides corti]|uniref:TNase-like domain-containing protein n=1 Tax=Mesocestoides corti TaxID=53468 RepID=A0A0R3U4T2_MESCO|nr:unnamed protein product [Mesocestoides corti]
MSHRYTRAFMHAHSRGAAVSPLQPFDFCRPFNRARASGELELEEEWDGREEGRRCPQTHGVLSDDTIVVRERALDGPPKSFTVMLSNISCPRVARKPGANGKGGVDEAFGWMAREFVRAKVVGKEICYAVESEVSPDRVFGSIFLRQPGGVQNLAYLLVSEGLAKVKKGGQALVHLEMYRGA